MSVPLELEGYHLKYGKLDEAGAGEPRAANGEVAEIGRKYGRQRHGKTHGKTHGRLL